MDEGDLSALEDRLRYWFVRRELLVEALTHPSFANEHKGAASNARLEFIGDAVLSLTIARALFDAAPGDREDDLTRKRIEVVRNDRLPAVARRLGLNLRLGAGERKNAGGEPKRLGDAVEALIGAVYLDAGPEHADRVIRELLRDEILSATRREG